MSDAGTDEQSTATTQPESNVEPTIPAKKGLPVWVSVIVIVVVLAAVGVAYLQLTKEKPLVLIKSVKTKPSATPPTNP